MYDLIPAGIHRRITEGISRRTLRGIPVGGSEQVPVSQEKLLK